MFNFKDIVTSTNFNFKQMQGAFVNVLILALMSYSSNSRKIGINYVMQFNPQLSKHLQKNA